MRWLKDPLIDCLHDVRIIEKFLWCPTYINNEWRWWEKAKIKQKVVEIDVGGSMEWGNYKNMWINEEWVDE